MNRFHACRWLIGAALLLAAGDNCALAQGPPLPELGNPAADPLDLAGQIPLEPIPAEAVPTAASQSFAIDPSWTTPGVGCESGYDDDFAPAPLVPFDWVRHFGFRHSSTHGRHVGRGLPLEKTSWLNRPFHVDWFAGPLVTTNVVDGRVGQGNDMFSGLRLGWDFDYFWGMEWRIGWANPNLFTATDSQIEGNYMVSDVNVVYYPWGDSKVRPYCLWGVGMAEVGSVRTDGTGQEAVLVGMPFGGGVRIAQSRQITWRLEAINNMAFGSDGLSTLHNLSLTLGMEIRLGARPKSYWPWRTGRTVW
ncbi:MAG: hypothetical protein KDA61_01610 [Planctomycetales bacterium]|nr:hypothetical protein [Planctomycetales bacterium]